MNFTNFSLSRESIQNAFGKKMSPQKNPPQVKVVTENDDTHKCDKCEYKTSKIALMRDHILVKHSGVKNKCTECNYQHHFPNRVQRHFKQVHMGIPRNKNETCKSTQCPNFATTKCLFLEDHILHHCEQCNFTQKKVIT